MLYCYETCSVTDGDGTATELFTSKHRSAGTYRLHFKTGAYFDKCGMETLYPHIDVSVIRLRRGTTLMWPVVTDGEVWSLGLSRS